MSTYVLMRILESAPRRYDAGIGMLTLGQVGRAYDRLARAIAPGETVLDLGCGTGALTVRAARRGAVVKGLDVNPEMLEIARRHAEAAGVSDRVTLVEAGVAELDAEAPASYDAVTAGLCFSELGADELAYTLAEVARILKPGGRLLVADEVRPRRLPGRVLHGLIRVPLAAVTFLLTQQTTRPVTGLPARLADAGLTLVAVRAGGLGSFATFEARRPPAETP
jgi:ubiquinone/menaquinone biosynthesis C-methylase UbiE